MNKATRSAVEAGRQMNRAIAARDEADELRKRLEALVTWVDNIGVTRMPALAGIDTTPLDRARAALSTSN